MSVYLSMIIDDGMNTASLCDVVINAQNFRGKMLVFHSQSVSSLKLNISMKVSTLIY